MISFYLNILFIQLIFVIGLDILGFWKELSGLISKWFFKTKEPIPFELKPFSCSTCMGFWTNIIYMFIAHQFSIFNVFIIIVLAMFAPEMGYLICLFKDWIAKLIQTLTPKK